jgi:uncharacterized protein YdcH (DUF465 family)
MMNQVKREGSMVTDEHIAESLRTSNEEYRELEESHHRLDAELQQLLKRHVLTPQEEILKKHIQKEKLGKKDRMAALIRDYRATLEQAGTPG